MDVISRPKGGGVVKLGGAVQMGGGCRIIFGGVKFLSASYINRVSLVYELVSLVYTPLSALYISRRNLISCGQTIFFWSTRVAQLANTSVLKSFSALRPEFESPRWIIVLVFFW